MCAGARLVRSKETVADTAGNALFLCPLHGLVVVGAGGHITERAYLNFLDKGSIDFNLAGGHGKGIFAVTLVGQFQFVSVLVNHGEFIQFEAVVRLDGNRHGAAAGSIFRADGHSAVLRFVGCDHGIARGENAGRRTAAGRRLYDQRCDGIFNGFRHCIHFGLLCDILAAHNSFKCCFHSGKIYIIVLVQSIRLCDGCINCGIVSRVSSKYRIELALCESSAKQLGNCAIRKFID